jgi:hypothetical protein
VHETQHVDQTRQLPSLAACKHDVQHARLVAAVQSSTNSDDTVQQLAEIKPTYSVPRVVYTYWNRDEPPEHVHDCMRTWRRYMPEYQHVLITPSTRARYMEERVERLHWNDCPQREADIVRACVLRTHGGVWMDASILLTGRPSALLDAVDSGLHQFVGYAIHARTTNPAFPVVENWCFATVARGAFITAWRNVFMDVAPGQSVVSRALQLASHVDVQGIGNLPYFLMHVSAQMVLQTQPHAARDCLFLRAEDGPLKYLFVHAWQARAAALSLVACMCSGCSTGATQPATTTSPSTSTSTSISTPCADIVTPVIKITGAVRGQLSSEDWRQISGFALAPPTTSVPP